MMSAPALPTPQGAMPAGFATFLANIGQLPEGGGEGGGFDQLLAAAPVAVAPSAHAAATIKIDPAAPSEAVAPQIDTPPLKDAVSETPVVKAEPAETGAATLAANLLIALGGSAPVPAPKPGKPVPAETEPDAAPGTAETADAVPAAPATDLAAVVAAVIPAATKPTKPVEAPPARADAEAPEALLAARPRDARAPLPILNGAEAPVAKPG